VNRRLAALGAALLLNLAACGGGDGGGTTQVIDLTPRPPQGPACAHCTVGVLSGVAAVGAPLGAAEVRISDAAGRTVTGRTDAQGAYRIALGDLQGSLIVQVDGLDAGQPVQLHALQSAEETAAGARAVHVTPLTELIAAEVLGAPPRALLTLGQADHRRIVERALAQAEARLLAALRPLLDAAGLPATVELRGGEFAADGQGLDGLLEMLRIEPMGSGWEISVVGSNSLQRFDPASPQLAPLAATADLSALRQQRQAAQVGIEAALGRLAAQFAGSNLPEAAALQAQLAGGFRHAGLDGPAYVDRVLLRRDAPDEGGFDWLGLRVEALRVLDLRSDGAALARWRAVPRAPFAAQEQRMWFLPDATGWRLAGDGASARVALRHAVLLAPAGLDEADLQALPGLSCSSDATAPDGARCTLPSGALGLPVAGLLDLGARGDGAFGVLGLFRADSGTATARHAAAAAHSLRWGQASQRLQRQLLFEVDAREVDARVARIRITGGALPADGVHLLAPALGVNGPVFEHWPLALDTDTDWAGRPWGWCAPAVSASACQLAWQAMRSGAVLRFELLDAAGQLIDTVERTLPPEPDAAALQGASALPRMARFDSGAADSFAPHYAHVLALGDTRLAARLRWQAPATDGATLQLRLHWQRADALGQGGTENRHRRLALSASTNAPLDLVFDARVGWLSTWWSARLDTTRDDGLRYLHVLAPGNPQ
jgi:hypothetical protein